MSRGPLPSAQKRRRSQPTISNTELPAEGRKGRAPAVPEPYKLKKAGRAWWNWAWKLPQATKWDEGSRWFVARRAQLEDDLAALELFDEFDLAELLGMDEDNDALRRLGEVIGQLKRLAGGSTSLMKEMRELDNRLGLNPKALADLRWSIAEKSESGRKPAKGKGGKKSDPEVAELDAYRNRVAG